ncbi:MAG: HlyC/CorC family transporter [Bacteroidales bacterium]|nr:HlyC/CorC family transporter [Bacteroidales bacterium]
MSPTVIILLSLVLSAFFSGMEIAYVSSNRLKIELDRKHGAFSSRIIGIFTKKPGHYIATMLVGNSIVLVIYGFFISGILEPKLAISLKINHPALMIFLQTLIAAAIILITSEFLPKTFFRSRPNLFLSILSVPVFLFYIILYPITLITIVFTNFFMRFVLGKKIRMNSEASNPVFGTMDLAYLMNETQSRKTSDQEMEPEKKIFQNALEFSSLKVRDCMVPRTDIEALELNSSIADLNNKFVETGYSKILIFEESIDNITGYISSKNLFKAPENLKSQIIPLSFVPETMNVNKLFRKLIKERKSIAVVVDEYGGTSGIITLEDIIEEIFGEIEDEHDTVEFIERQINASEFIFSGRLEIDYLNDRYKFNLPESEEYDTLAGYIIHNHKSIPRLNNLLQIQNFRYRILKVSQTRIELVHVKWLNNE